MMLLGKILRHFIHNVQTVACLQVWNQFSWWNAQWCLKTFFFTDIIFLKC